MTALFCLKRRITERGLSLKTCVLVIPTGNFIASHGTVNPVKTMTKEQLAQLPIRRLTPEEAFMLQGFPADFAVNGRNAGVADGSLYKQEGNAVSVNAIYAALYYLITNHIIHE